MADIRLKAVATAESYNQGNIANLDDATTRRLVASTVLTYGVPDPDASNRLGFVGRYQAGARWLAEAGFIDPEKPAQAMSEAGMRSEWAWAKSGAMTAFLQDPGNWNNGLSLGKYTASPELQDRAFKITSDKVFDRAMREGVLSGDERPELVAGFLKASKFVGYESAANVLEGGRVFRDPLGRTNYEIVHHISRDGDRLRDLMQPAQQTPQHAAGLAMEDVRSPYHGMYQKAYEAFGGIGLDDRQRANAAGALVVFGASNGVDRFDHVLRTDNGGVFAVKGELQDPSHSKVYMEIATAAKLPLQDSNVALADRPVLQDSPLLERSRQIQQA